MNTKFKIGTMALLGALSVNPVLAQEHVGNGGGEDVEFHKITSEIQIWMKKNQEQGKLDAKLQLSAVGGTKLYLDFNEAVNSTTLKFQDQAVMVNGQSRVCGNDINPNRIICNRTLWNHQTAGNLKYAIVLHEYLGVAGYERNIIEYSQYPISKNILDFVYEKTVFELGMEKKTPEYDPVKDEEFIFSCIDSHFGHVYDAFFRDGKLEASIGDGHAYTELKLIKAKSRNSGLDQLWDIMHPKNQNEDDMYVIKFRDTNGATGMVARNTMVKMTFLRPSPYVTHESKTKAYFEDMSVTHEFSEVPVLRLKSTMNCDVNFKNLEKHLLGK